MALAIAIAASLVPAAAQADTAVMGPVDLTSPPLIISARLFTYVQTGDAAKYKLLAPTDGVVTKWRVNLRIGGTVKLLALTPRGDGTYTQRGAGVEQNGKPGMNEFNDFIPVSEGDALGLQLTGAATRVWARQEEGGTFVARDDGHNSGSFVKWDGYYILFNADLQYAQDFPDPPKDFPPGGFPPRLPGFGDDDGGSDPGSGGSGSDAPAPPTVSGIAPASGSTAGGDFVAISGNGFDSAKSVFFGGVEAPSFTIDGFDRITAVTPAHGEGAVDVEVVNAGGLSSRSGNAVFSFVAPPQPVVAPAPAPAQAASTVKRRVRCAHAPTLVGRTVSGARKLMRRYGCGTNLRIVMVGRRHAHRRVKVRSQSPAPRRAMRRDRRILIRVR